MIRRLLIACALLTLARHGLAADETPVPAPAADAPDTAAFVASPGTTFDMPLPAPELPGPMRHGGGYALFADLFSPMMLMHHEEQIGLTPEQVDAIQEETRQYQAGVVALQWKLERAARQFRAQLGAEKIDEQGALATFGKLTASENDLRTLHFQMLVRLRNLLTPEQVQMLKDEHPRPWTLPLITGADDPMLGPDVFYRMDHKDRGRGCRRGAKHHRRGHR